MTNTCDEDVTLKQKAMSFLSAGVNTGVWNRAEAQELVRQMLEADWHGERAAKDAAQDFYTDRHYGGVTP